MTDYSPPITGTGSSQAMTAADQADAINAAIASAVATEATARDAAIDTHAATEATARAAAITTAVAAEASARASAITSAVAAEATARDAAIATHGATEASARAAAITTAVAAEATARASAISSAVATETTARTAADTALRKALGDPATRPGTNPVAFVNVTYGAPEGLTAISDVSGIGQDTISGLGVVTVVNAVAETVAPRAPYPVHAGRIYRVHAYVERLTDPSDPVGNLVRLGLQRLNASFASLGSTVLADRTLWVADGAWHLTATVALTPAPDAADIAIGADTVYIRPFVQCFTTDHRTAIAEIEIIDITEGTVATASAAVLARAAYAFGAEDATEFPVDIVGPDGRSHMAISREGEMRVGHYRSLTPVDLQSEDAPFVLGLISDDNDIPLVGWGEPLANPDAGGLVFIPHPDTAKAVLQRGGVGSTARLRFGTTLHDPIKTATMLYGKVNSHGAYFPVAERNTGATTAAVIQRSDVPIQFDSGLGQSNYGRGGIPMVNPLVFEHEMYPHEVFGFSVAGVRKFISGTPTGAEVATVVEDLWPLRDSLSASYFPPSQGIFNAFGYAAAYRAAGEPGPGIISHCIFDGGEPIETFIEGTPAFDLLIGYATESARIAALYGRTITCSSLTFIQGDGGSASTYATVLDELTTSLQTQVTAAMGLETPPTLIIWQTAHRDDSTTIDLNAIHQAEAAAARPADIKISVPMHTGRRGEGDPIHIDPESRMFLGAMHGEVKRRVDSGEGWSTFRVASATLSGNTITLAYTCPSLRDLEFDPGRTADPVNGWVPAAPHYGYRYADDSSGVTIASVALAKNSNGLLHNVVLTLTGNPGAATGKVVGVGDTNDLVTQWAPYRCQLRMKAGLRSVWRDMGFDVPEHVYHYAIRERITL